MPCKLPNCWYSARLALLDPRHVMKWFKLTVCYEGTRYVGWQVQPNGISIQQVLESAWTNVTGETTRIVGSGRTDAGVHALGQVCSVQTESALPPETLRNALNANLPEDVVVLDVERARDSFHAIADAASKSYWYFLQFGWPHNLFHRQTCWRIKHSLDIEAMQAGAKWLVGQHDFASFQAAGASTRTTVRTIKRLEISAEPVHLAGQGRGVGGRSGQTVKFEIEADGFLYNMVRNIVGSLERVGAGKYPPDWICAALSRRDRSAAGPTAPAHGLFLAKVEYPGECFPDDPLQTDS